LSSSVVNAGRIGLSRVAYLKTNSHIFLSTANKLGGLLLPNAIQSLQAAESEKKCFSMLTGIGAVRGDMHIPTCKDFLVGLNFVST
jgi:hypothetical protein